jgi:addiction module HigA family antidote
MSTKEYSVNEIERTPTHPGALLREDVLPAMDMTVAEFARGIGLSRQSVHKILAERKGITPEVALRIGKFVGNGPGIWLSMQQNYDLWHARQAMADTLDRIETRSA